MQQAQEQSPQSPSNQPPAPQSREQAEAKVAQQASQRNPFEGEAGAAKRKAIIEALRDERGVAPAEPSKAASADATGTSAEQDKPEQSPQAQPQSTEDATKAALEDYDRKLRATMATEASAEAKRAEAERLAREASEKLAKIESAKSDPLEFLGQLGITETDFQKYLAQTIDTPEMRRIQAVEKSAKAEVQKLTEQFEAYKKEMQSAREQEQLTTRRSQAQQLLQSDDYLITRKATDADAILRRQAELEAHTGQSVSLADAAKHLETSFRDDLKRILSDNAIRDMYYGKPQSVSTAESHSPTTLNSAFRSDTEPGEGVPAPLDWEAKRKLLFERLRREQEQQRL